MGVADLGRAPAVPLERAARIGGQRRGVALDQGDLVAVPAQRQRRPEPATPAPTTTIRLLVSPPRR